VPQARPSLNCCCITHPSESCDARVRGRVLRTKAAIWSHRPRNGRVRHFCRSFAAVRAKNTLHSETTDVTPITSYFEVAAERGARMWRNHLRRLDLAKAPRPGASRRRQPPDSIQDFRMTFADRVVPGPRSHVAKLDHIEATVRLAARGVAGWRPFGGRAPGAHQAGL
jgi:hypothetical protein